MKKVRTIFEAINSGDVDVIDPTTGELAYVVSPFILNQNNAWDNLEYILDMHMTKLVIYSEMKRPGITTLELKDYGKMLKELEYHLQDLWGFPRDEAYHRFWEYPNCTCPKLDNSDAYPYQQYYALGCPIHGEIK